MLLVVEESVEVVLGIAAPAGLILEVDAVLRGFGLIGEPDGERADCFIVGQAVLETLLVRTGDPEAIDRRQRRQPAGVGVNRNRGGEGVERRDAESISGGRRRARGLFFFDGSLDLAGPSDDGVAPRCSVGGEVGKGVEEGGLATAGFKVLEAVPC
ncbi:hypothetical protein G7Z17_g6893 [Cylindrodendrum hubeiense]|uniref:Uncharacterized protein n=1 Tax=Cylindrodendrum hubeiense TaxID=595255 RepID=A0A9P5H6I8_9HYPO|nr:hypothetical protein G7Z17_g6893 [Cylindrodendrum hubeiense]